MIEVLKELVFFVVKTSSKDALKCEGIPIIQRQILLKYYRIIELCIDVLYYPFKYRVHDLSHLKDKRFILILRLCYRVIDQVIRQNYSNELYAAQWINMMINQSIFTDDENDIGSEEALTQLIINNKRILDTRIKDNTASKFVQMVE